MANYCRKLVETRGMVGKLKEIYMIHHIKAILKNGIVSVGLIVTGSSSEVVPPKPYGPIPSARQLAWHQLEFYGFLHFGINTFTDKEWGYGDEDPNLFSPTEFNPKQWAHIAKEAGMKALILTAKHHDGFCLWPSKYTKHSIRYSKWMGGHADVVKAVAEACQHYGLKFGIYLSPWDRNHPDYGKAGYIEYYRNQLVELLTNYGPIFEVWFDGANGGTGYYGGAREDRRIDRANYYQWPHIWQIVRKLQPDAVIFSDAGPDIRWVGNERGIAFDPCWLTITLDGLYPGHPEYATKYAQGDPNGKDWCPPEVDVSIRPGWFYHASEDSKVKSVDQLLEIYYHSIGRSANLLLNIPPDKRGLIPEIDAAILKDFRKALLSIFQEKLNSDAIVTASNIRGNSSIYSPSNVIDEDFDTYWATDDDQLHGWIELEMEKEIRFDHVVLQEYITLGQRVEKWELLGWINGQWKPLYQGTTIGYKRILKINPTKAQKIRLHIIKAKACPLISTFNLYVSPQNRG